MSIFDEFEEEFDAGLDIPDEVIDNCVPKYLPLPSELNRIPDVTLDDVMGEDEEDW